MRNAFRESNQVVQRINKTKFVKKSGFKQHLFDTYKFWCW